MFEPEVFGFLQSSDQKQLAQTCRRWRHIAGLALYFLRSKKTLADKKAATASGCSNLISLNSLPAGRFRQSAGYEFRFADVAARNHEKNHSWSLQQPPLLLKRVARGTHRGLPTDLDVEFSLKQELLHAFFSTEESVCGRTLQQLQFEYNYHVARDLHSSEKSVADERPAESMTTRYSNLSRVSEHSTFLSESARPPLRGFPIKEEAPKAEYEQIDVSDLPAPDSDSVDDTLVDGQLQSKDEDWTAEDELEVDSVSSDEFVPSDDAEHVEHEESEEEADEETPRRSRRQKRVSRRQAPKVISKKQTGPIRKRRRGLGDDKNRKQTARSRQTKNAQLENIAIPSQQSNDDAVCNVASTPLEMQKINDSLLSFRKLVQGTVHHLSSDMCIVFIWNESLMLAALFWDEWMIVNKYRRLAAVQPQ